MGKMACCTKAIFRGKWGLSESGLMAVGVVPAMWVASCRKYTVKYDFQRLTPSPCSPPRPGRLGRLSAGSIGEPTVGNVGCVSAVKRSAFVLIISCRGWTRPRGDEPRSGAPAAAVADLSVSNLTAIVWTKFWFADTELSAEYKRLRGSLCGVVPDQNNACVNRPGLLLHGGETVWVQDAWASFRSH